LKKSIIKFNGSQSTSQPMLIKKYTYSILHIAFFCILLTGCAQISSLQTAKTLPEDKQIIGISANAYGINEAELIGSVLGLHIVPQVEIFGRQGFTKKFDAGLKISSSANIALDGKFQFLGNADSKFAMASGLVFEYQYVRNFEIFVSRQTLPVYISYHPNIDFAVYTVPKLMYQWIGSDENLFLLGNNLGIKKRIGKRFSIITEGSLFWLFDQKFKSSKDFIYQGGLGIMFDL